MTVILTSNLDYDFSVKVELPDKQEKYITIRKGDNTIQDDRVWNVVSKIEVINRLLKEQVSFFSNGKSISKNKLVANILQPTKKK